MLAAIVQEPGREQSEQLVTNQSKNAKALHSRNHNVGACPVSPPAPKPDLAAGLRPEGRPLVSWRYDAVAGTCGAGGLVIPMET
jgi:hypothetical protein